MGRSQQNFFKLILWASNRRFEHLHNRGHVALPVGKEDGLMLKGKGVLEETNDDVGAQPVSSLIPSDPWDPESSFFGTPG